MEGLGEIGVGLGEVIGFAGVFLQIEEFDAAGFFAVDDELVVFVEDDAGAGEVLVADLGIAVVDEVPGRDAAHQLDQRGGALLEFGVDVGFGFRSLSGGLSRRRHGPAGRGEWGSAEPEFGSVEEGEVNCRERLGGLLRYYHRDAA